MKSIINGLLYVNQKFVKDYIIIFEENIKALLTRVEYETYKKEHIDLEEIDAKGDYIVPGFIDVHIHGYKNVDVMDGKVSSISKISKDITENGVCAYLPTTMTMPMDSIIKALETIREVKDGFQDGAGALVLGAHLEGPFINEEFKGAQPKEFIEKPDESLVEQFKDVIKVITIAPEIPGAMDFIEKYANDFNFSIGHSGASYETAKEAINKGVKSTTHLFNAMTGVHHREPGIVGAAFTSDCYSEVIADKFHIHPDLYKLIVKAKGLEKILLITDCMRAGGLEEGTYDLGGQMVTVKNGQCRLSEGTIAGSVLKLNEGLRNFDQSLEENLEQLIPLVTSNQARYLGVEDELGSLEVNKIANIVMMNKEIQINKTIVKGKVAYEN